MATTDKDQQAEIVRQHARMANGAWVDGEQLQEKGSSTLPKANKDHGNFTSAIRKDNAQYGKYQRHHSCCKSQTG